MAYPSGRRPKISRQATAYRVTKPKINNTKPRIKVVSQGLCNHLLPQGPAVETQRAKRSCTVLDESNLPDPKRQKRPLNTSDSKELTTDSSIQHWIDSHRWPKELFKPHPMHEILARKKSSSSLGRKRLDDGSPAPRPNDEKTREDKSASYREPMYEEQLQIRGFFMRTGLQNPNSASIKLCKELQEKQVDTPNNSNFADDRYQYTFENMRDRNETRVIRDIALLIVPSAEQLGFDDKSLQVLAESTNEGWNLADPITAVRPQPDFSVGYKRAAFTERQLDKLRPALGDSRTQVSRLRATWYIYFPFLSCEVKCGAGGLDIADRQNAHSMGIAVRAIVDLYRLAGREKELNRKILAFSISHDNRSVRVYGYYAVILSAEEDAQEEEASQPESNEALSITFHRYSIFGLDLQHGDRWKTYKFVNSIYNSWAPDHLQNIRAIIDSLPDNVFRPTESTGLSQRLDESQISTAESFATEQLESADPANLDTESTPETSFSTKQTSTSKKTPTRRGRK